MCYSPISIQVEGKGRISVACGKCAECLQRRRSEWTFRLMEELKEANTAYFITLTYSDENIPDNKEQMIEDHQLYMKRLRKANKKYTKKQVRYFTVSEFGEHTGRPHYHSIIFNMAGKCMLDLENIWKLGHVHIGEVTQKSIHYCTKYVLVNQKEYAWKPFSLMTKRPYLGYNYLENKEVVKYHKKNEKNSITHVSGNKLAMPRIYKNRMYSKITRDVNALEAIRESDKNNKKMREKAKKRKINYEKRMAENRRYYSKQMVKQSKSKEL